MLLYDAEPSSDVVAYKKPFPTIIADGKEKNFFYLLFLNGCSLLHSKQR